MRAEILVGDCRKVLAELPAESVHCVVTSPPYFGLRDYGHPDQIGLEETPQEYVAGLVDVFRQVRRVLRPDGVVWLNLGDSYASDSKWGGQSGDKNKASGAERRRVHTGLKDKDLIGIPWRVAFALQDDGWWLRRDVIWEKPNAMPESVTDRPSGSHEYVFLLTKSPDYFYDAEAIREPMVKGASGSSFHEGKTGVNAGSRVSVKERTDNPNGRNKRSVWRVNTAQYKGAHYATFPPDLVAPMILAGCPEGGIVLDPFGGSGTVGEVATRLNRRAFLIELNPDYARQAETRNAQAGLGL